MSKSCPKWQRKLESQNRKSCIRVWWMGLKGGFHMFQLLFGVLILAVSGVLIWFGGQQANEGWKKIHYKESVDIQFISTLFFHKLDKRPLDDHLHGDDRLKFGGGQFGGTLSLFISNHLEKCGDLNKAEFNKNPEKIVEFYHNLMLLKLIDQFLGSRPIFSSFLTNWPIMELKSLISSSFLPPRKLLDSLS